MTDINTSRPTLIAHHRIQYSDWEMQQFPQIAELDNFLKRKQLHISGLFVAKTYDVHPGEMARQLQEMIITSRTLPYYTKLRV